MNGTKASLMITLFSCMGQGNNHYTKVSVDSLQRLLKKHHETTVQRRWIFACIKNLLSSGLITRKSRYRQDENGLISQIPSMIAFTLKGAKYLFSKRITGAVRLLKNILRFVSGDDKRWPRPEDITPSVTPEERKKNFSRLQKLLNTIGGGGRV